MKAYFNERKSVIIFAVLVMAVTLIPYLIGYGTQGENWRFTGFIIGVQDGNSYIAKMLSGASGNWLFRSPYSSEIQRGVLAFLPYILLGKLTSPPAQHEQLVALYHGFRCLAGFLAILASYDFLGLFVREKKVRFWGLVLVVLGGGLGWILVLIQQKSFLGSIPLDFISPESFGFIGLLGFPHLAAARAFLLWGFVLYLKRDTGWMAGLLWLVMGFFQPMVMLIVWCVIALHAVALTAIKHWYPDLFQAYEFRESRYIRIAAQAILISSPLVIYTTWSFLTDPYLLEWSRQNVLPSPHWGHYLVAYGLVLPFSVVGAIRGINRSPRSYILLIGWMVAFPILVSAPVSTQRRLAEGIWVVLIAGMMSFFDKKGSMPVYVKIISLLILPTSLLLWLGGITVTVHPGNPAFLPSEQVDAYLELGKIVSPNSIVLSAYKSGNSLPAWVPVRVVIGHGPETIHLNDWQQLLDTYLNGNGEIDTCVDLFVKKGVDYLFWGPEEKTRWDWDPTKQNCLLKMGQNGDYTYYKVIE